MSGILYMKYLSLQIERERNGALLYFTLIRLDSARFLHGLCSMRCIGKVIISKTSATARMVFKTADTHHDSGLKTNKSNCLVY